jgi:methylated-DNA-protein-cysteine methyltransferase-like protein
VTSESDGRDQAAARIRATVDAIPPGRLATYSGVAREAALERRARLVGRVLRELPAGTTLPWHRVVRANGRVAARGGAGEALQLERLAREGLVPDGRGRFDLEAHGMAW